MDLDETNQLVRTKLHQFLSGSGLLEYGCPTPECQTQIFSTWEINVTCNRCGQRVVSRYVLDCR